MHEHTKARAWRVPFGGSCRDDWFGAMGQQVNGRYMRLANMLFRSFVRLTRAGEATSWGYM